MKAYEVPVKITEKGTVEIPGELTPMLQPGSTARMILLIDEPGDADRETWARLGQEQFLAGYDEADAIYDALD
jgi:hypothetical protein